jgi:hypothetical protein
MLLKEIVSESLSGLILSILTSAKKEKLQLSSREKNLSLLDAK